MNPFTLSLPSNWYRQVQMEDPVHYDSDFRFYFGGQGTQLCALVTKAFAPVKRLTAFWPMPCIPLSIYLMYRHTWRIISVTFPWHLYEVLHFQPSVQTMCRIVRKDVELGGQQL